MSYTVLQLSVPCCYEAWGNEANQWSL